MRGAIGVFYHVHTPLLLEQRLTKLPRWSLVEHKCPTVTLKLGVGLSSIVRDATNSNLAQVAVVVCEPVCIRRRPAYPYVALSF